MGFVDAIGDLARRMFSLDKEHAPSRIAQGQTGNLGPGTPFDLITSYGYEAVSEYLRLENDLLSRYADMENMDDYPLVSAALDTYADNATQLNVETGRTLWVTSPDTEVERLLDDTLIRRKLRLEEDLWEIARSLCKYGNDYEELLVTGDGVIGLNHLPPATTRRIETNRGELLGFVQDKRGGVAYSPEEFHALMDVRNGAGGAPRFVNGKPLRTQGIPFEDWEVVHFRLRGKHRRSAYGWSVLDGARWIWKRLVLLEDAALLYRLQRAPERFAFYIDVGNMPGPQALAYVNQVRQTYKKKRFMNPANGNQFDAKLNAMGQDEDFFVPTRGGQRSTEIDVLGSPNWQHMDDIEYFLKLFFAAIRIPKAYLNQEEGVARAVLSSQDVGFARTVLRIQQAMRQGVGSACRVDLAALGINPYDVEFDVQLCIPSAIFELAQMEVLNARADFAGRMGSFVSLYWILSTVFKMRDEDIQAIFTQRDEDAKRAAASGGGGGFGGGGGGFEAKRAPLEKLLFDGRNRENEKRMTDAWQSGKLHPAVEQRFKETHGLLTDIVTSLRPLTARRG